MLPENAIFPRNGSVAVKDVFVPSIGLRDVITDAAEAYCRKVREKGAAKILHIAASLENSVNNLRNIPLAEAIRSKKYLSVKGGFHALLGSTYL